MIRLASCPKVGITSPDFGYVEFQNPEGAIQAANSNDHFINGKKASVQFFKTKDAQKKGYIIQEDNERAEVLQTNPILSSRGNFNMEQFQYDPQCGENTLQKIFFNPKQVSIQNQHNLMSSRHFGYPCLQRNQIVQPSANKVAPQKRVFQDFYNSLRMADIERNLAETYLRSNMRFNKTSATNH